MKQLPILVLIAVLTVSIFACDGDTAEAPTAPATAAKSSEATQSPVKPTNTPMSEQRNTLPPEPTSMPTATSAPTAALEPTATLPPTAEPKPTAEPSPTHMATTAPAPTAAATFTPEPEPTPASASPIAADLAALGDNLLWVAHFDRATQKWSVYDASGAFTPDSLPIPNKENIPDASEIAALIILVPEKIYSIAAREKQTVEFDGRSFTLYPGANPMQWK